MQAVLKAVAVHWRCVLRQLVASQGVAQDERSLCATLSRVLALKEVLAHCCVLKPYCSATVACRTLSVGSAGIITEGRETRADLKRRRRGERDGDMRNFRYQATRHDRAMSKLLLFLLLAGCAAPSRAVYFYTKDTYGHYRLRYVAVPYTALGFYPVTYSKAQGTLDDFCNLPVADINRILQTVTDRFAKEIVCKQDSVHNALRRARAEQAKTQQAINPNKLSRAERRSDPHEFNAGSPNPEGGTDVYIDVSHGHPE